jgi:hypothetical protein
LTAVWIAVGVVSAIQLRFWATWQGAAVDFWALAARQVRNAMPWIPLTLIVFALTRRFPLRSIGLSRWLGLHVAVGALTVIALNAVQVSLHWIVEGPMREYAGWWDAVVSETLLWGHAAFLVYAVLVCIAWLRVERRTVLEQTPLDRTSLDFPAVEVRAGNSVHFIDPELIDWIEGAGDYARLHVKGRTYLSSERLGALGERLATYGILRIHRSAIVNLARVIGYAPASHGDFVLELEDGVRVNGSRRHRDVLDLIKQRAGSS